MILSEKANKGPTVLEDNVLYLIKYRFSIQENYGLSLEILAINKLEDLDKLGNRVDKLLDKYERHTWKMMACLERKKMGEESKTLI